MDGTRPAPRALMACLGEASRFRLVKALLGGARCVTDLAAAVGLSQSCTTRHLQLLERRQVVRGTRDGKRVMYRLRDEDPGLMPLLVWALEFADGAALAPDTMRSGAGPLPAERSAPRRSGGASRPVRRRAGALAPIPEPVTEPIPPTEPEQATARRAWSSDIEDYLL